MASASGSTPFEPFPGSTNNDEGKENPYPTSNTEGVTGSSATPDATDDTAENLVLGKRRKFISWVWSHFKIQNIKGEEKAVCNYCKKPLGGKSRNGTKHLASHYEVCPKRIHRDIAQDFAQKKLKIQESGDKKGHVAFFNGGFDEEIVRRELCNMVIMHEYPLSIVEHLGFRKYTKALQPSFKMMSRNTLRSDILKVYDHEKTKTMKLLMSVDSKVAITTDMWTAQNQKRGFIAITAHWIDSSWTLQSRILRFAYVPCPHTAECISEELLKCFTEWNINKKLSALTVDNCSSNDAIINILKDRMDLRTFPLHGKFFHMRCCAHILNLIVKDGLEVIGDSIEKVRDSVSYWRATPKREEIFQEVCDSLSIPYLKKLKLDCKTRWNSTFLMLQTALLYKEVFPKLAKRDSNYKSVPSDDEWEKATDLCERLEVFYDVTQIFSGTDFPTSNTYIQKVFEIRSALDDWLLDSNVVIKTMARKMLDKFDKYWNVIHGIMGVACVLDPRFKLKMLECYYFTIYDLDGSDKVDMVKDTCYDLWREYKERYKHLKPIQPHEKASMSCDSGSSLETCSVGSKRKKDFMSKFDTYVKKDAPLPEKCELDTYLNEPLVPRTGPFDILVYWKAAQTSFPILSKIARDIYAIPVSTVASESAFSTGGRFVSPHRNRLHPKTLEALMCARDWLWATVDSQGAEEGVDDTNAIPFWRTSFEGDVDEEVKDTMV